MLHCKKTSEKDDDKIKNIPILITGVQKVAPERCWFWYTRPSRPMTLPVAVHIDLLKEQDVVMGSAVLDAPGRFALWLTPGPDRPCVASLHHW
jgi:hypothetical protein